MKKQILRELDEEGLLAGSLVHQALLANDRAKYLMTLLQLAFDQARDPADHPDGLGAERRNVAIDDASLDSVIAEARRNGNGRFRIPGASRVTTLLGDACREMLEPIVAMNAPEAGNLRSRLDQLISKYATIDENDLTEDWLERVTSGSRAGGDTLHLVVMDAHRVLNRIQRDLTETLIDGVPAIGLEESDRPLVQAFVFGVRRTSHLRLDHPGLDTTASRYGGRLVIQNDVGTTDSHVVVVAVTEHEIEITYTDLHYRRLTFFRRRLDRFTPQWKETATRSSDKLEEGDRFYVLRGVVHAPTEAAKKQVLEGIGSRLVFLIDWNKARKRLRNFMPNKSAIQVIEAAADAEVGHMSFLKMGGEELIYQALDVAGSEYLRHGEPFHAAVRPAIARESFTEILKVCYEGISSGDSIQVVRDRVVASLNRAFMTKIRGNLGACRKQAGLVVEAALTLEQIMRFLRLRKDSHEFILRSRQRIAHWENEADDILNRVRRKESLRPSTLPVRDLSDAVDDALDHIDEAAYFIEGLRYSTEEAEAVRALRDLAGILVRCAQEFYKALSAASEATSRRSQEDLPEFFESIGRLDALAKRKNRKEREFLEVVFELSGHSGPVARLREIESGMSTAVNDLSRAGFLLYDSIFTPGQIGS